MFDALSNRKKEILDAIVTDFVHTAEPVGSFTVTRHYLRQVSPATVRNEMQELEEVGYITHPHTSAGRIPTDLGYRYYVDNIMETKEISGREIALIRNGIRKIGRGFEEIIHGTIKMISSFLNYATIFVAFGKKNLIFSTGISNMLRQPEFRSIDYARHVVETVEQEDLVLKILQEYSKMKDLTIRIGHENKFREVKDLSIVVAQCSLNGIDPGAIGIIGPTRMEYDRVKSILTYVSTEIESMINREALNA